MILAVNKTMNEEKENIMDKIPEHKFKCRFQHQTFMIWKDVSTDMMFKDKKVVIFGLPGAFTPTCSSKHLPEYEEKYELFKEQGIDDIYCISVNDAFVMNAWGSSLVPKVEKVFLCPDGDGKFTDKMKMLIDKPKVGFGLRSWRYSALVNNGVIEKMFIESGKNNESADEDPYEVSGATTMLDYLKDNK